MSPQKKDATQKIQVEHTAGDTQQIKTKLAGSDTQQIKTKPAGSDTQQIKLKPSKDLQVKKPKLWRVILTGILLVILFATAGGALGYKRGINDRLDKQNQQVISEAALQFQYGVQQMNAGNYSLARTHFEYVLKIYPDFPGLTDKYTEVMVQLAKANEPTATPAATPTPDTRDVETLFAQAQQEVKGKQWASAITTLEALRNEDYKYRTMEVDGLYYIAMRYRAVEMITKEGNLEEGLYYFSVLEKYAPLDKEAVNYSTVARLYLTGASFWDLDWQQVVNYFGQLYAAMPSLYDGSMTASQRYYAALIKYGDQLMDKGDECGAADQYSLALAMTPTDDLQSAYNKANRVCHPPTKEPTAVIEDTEVPIDEEPTEETTTEVTPEETTPADTAEGG
jgi:hypothetical protein